MSPDIRLEAVKIAQTLHTDIDAILASAGKLVHFISGHTDAPASEPTKTSTPRATKKAAAPEQTQPADQPSAETASPQANTAAVQQPAASTSKLTIAYDHVKALILKLSGSGPVGRAAALKVLQEHNVTKGPELKPEQYESAHAALTAAVVEVIPTTQA